MRVKPITLILLSVFLVTSGLGCKKIESLQKALLKPQKEEPGIEPVENTDLAQAILWPKPYPFKLRRDPFSPLLGKEALPSPDKAQIGEESKIKVIGIAIKQDNPVAIVQLPEGAFIFRQGDKVGQYTLKSIEPKRLILEDEKTNKTLILETGEKK